jgi:DNA-binding GntR family transcriptional regulator
MDTVSIPTFWRGNIDKAPLGQKTFARICARLYADDVSLRQKRHEGGEVMGMKEARMIPDPDAVRRSASTLSQQAYLALADLIRRRELPSEAPLVEMQLAERLGVSRTPLRQALQRLESEGLLRKDANRSFVIRRVELKEYLQSLRVREILEPEAAALVIGRVSSDEVERVREGLIRVRDAKPYDMLAHWRSDDEVHNLFIRGCGNDVLTRILLSLRGTTQLFEIERLVDRLEPDSAEHERILDALATGDVKAVRKSVASHINSLFRFAIEAVG